MKQLVKISWCALVFMVIGSSFGFGQELAKVEQNKKIFFDKESKPVEVKINSGEAYNYMRIHIQGYFTSGEAVFELYDPSGKKRGYYIIKTDSEISKGENTKVEESVSASMDKSFRNPERGDWMVKIIPRKGTGRVIIDSHHIFNSQVDVLEIEEIEGIDRIEKNSAIKKKN